MLTEGSFDTGEVEIHYHYARWNNAAAGGAPLLLSHGVTQSWCYWTPIVEAIGAGREIFALDQRGYGDSGGVQNGYRFIDYPRDQQALLHEVRPSRRC